MIEICDSSSWVEREKYWIARYRSRGANLTNHSIGGENGFAGHFHREDTKVKIGNAHKGKVISDEQKQKQSVAMYGRRLTDSHKAKVRAAMIGRVFTKEHRSHISENRKGKGKFAGELNANHKLTARQVSDIRASGLRPSAIARQYGISDVHAGKILRGMAWRS